MGLNWLKFFVVVIGLPLGLPPVCEALEIELGGQVRPRWEARNRDFNDATDPAKFISMRTRLSVKTTINDNISGFIQMQSVRTFGERLIFDDLDNSVGLHQGFLKVKNLFNLPLDLKFGRQEINLDGYRLLGNNGWNQGAQTHDAVTLLHHGKNYTAAYIFSQAVERSDETLGLEGNDSIGHIFWVNIQNVLSGKLSGYFIISDENTLSQTPFPENDFFTVGIRQAGKAFGLDYRGEFYYQFGDADLLTSRFRDSYRAAYMIGVRLGKKFGGPLKPGVTLWYDFLSGDDNPDSAFTAFDSLFGSTHKFLGFMDRFVSVGKSRTDGTLSAPNGTDSLGIQDIAFKFSLEPLKKMTFRTDMHLFYTAVEAHPAVVPAELAGDTHLGEEMDITLIYRYHPNLIFVAGYSYFWADDLMSQVGGRFGAPNDDNANWAYFMVDLTF